MSRLNCISRTARARDQQTALDYCVPLHGTYRFSYPASGTDETSDGRTTHGQTDRYVDSARKLLASQNRIESVCDGNVGWCREEIIPNEKSICCVTNQIVYRRHSNKNNKEKTVKQYIQNKYAYLNTRSSTHASLKSPSRAFSNAKFS